MTEQDRLTARRRACEALEKAGISITAAERETMEIADFGLNDFQRQGLSLIIYANNERYCAKELILLPGQTCPEHRHPPVTLSDGRSDPGKMETFRCRMGTVWLYVEGFAHTAAKASPPPSSAAHYTVFHEIELHPGDQFTIPSNVLHWFQGGPDGAIVTEFSSTSRDELDVFTDPNIRRVG